MIGTYALYSGRLNGKLEPFARRRIQYAPVHSEHVSHKFSHAHLAFHSAFWTAHRGLHTPIVAI